jgi:hypothetical protein
MKTPLLTYIVAASLLSTGVPDAALAASAQAQQVPEGKHVNPDAGLMAEFRKRVDDYVKLRDKAERAAPDLERTEKPAEIVTAEKNMGDRVRQARATAKRGDLFTPATEAMFRRTLKPPLTRGKEGADNKAIIRTTRLNRRRSRSR